MFAVSSGISAATGGAVGPLPMPLTYLMFEPRLGRFVSITRDPFGTSQSCRNETICIGR